MATADSPNVVVSAAVPVTMSRRAWMLRASAAGVAGIAITGAAPAQGRGIAKRASWDVREFGAAGDGATLDTTAVQHAVDACAASGGGTIMVPPGRYLIGTVELRSHVTLHLAAGATLLGSTDLTHYRAIAEVPLTGDSTLNDGNTPLLYAVRATNVTLEGQGTIDGQGGSFRTALANAAGNDRRPYLLMAYQCQRLTVCDLELREAGFHCLRVVQCNGVTMDRLSIHSRLGANKDGFHFISCRYVSVSNCTVLCNDDACALFGSCQQVAVTNCTFSTRWSVFRFGGGQVRNIAVSNCLLKDVFGCPIKLQGNEGSSYENLSFSNLVFDGVTGPIHLGVGPGATIVTKAGEDAVPLAQVDPATGAPAGETMPAMVRNVSFNHISGTVITDPKSLPGDALYPGEQHQAIVFNCVGGGTMEGISLSQIRLVFGGGGTAAEGARRKLPRVASEYFQLGPSPAYGIYARGVRGLSLTDVRLEVGAPDHRPAVVMDSVEDAVLSGLSAEGDLLAESVVRVTNCVDLLISSPRVLTPAAVFLQVEGSRSARVTVEGGDVRRAGRTITADVEATLASVTNRL